MFRKMRCWFGLHTMNGPTDKDVDSFYYCKGNCGSYVRWELGAPRYGYWGTFGTLHPFMVELKETEKKNGDQG